MDASSTEQRDGDQAEVHEPNRGGVRWLVWIPLFLLLYILSSGPVARLAFRGTIPLQAYYIVYAPIQELSGYCRPLENFMNWYVLTVWRARS